MENTFIHISKQIKIISTLSKRTFCNDIYTQWQKKHCNQILTFKGDEQVTVKVKETL